MDRNNDIPRSIRQVYRAIAIGCGEFIGLTLLAMLTYTGGWVDNHSAARYSFTRNFLSNLGMLTALSGKSNWLSAILVFVSLASAGGCLVGFFILFPRFFQNTRWQRVLCAVGSGFGVLAGMCFTGIAFAPADIARPVHIQFVMWAFRLFPLAVLCYLPVMFGDKSYPKLYAWVFAVFCSLLIGYYILMTSGPDFTTLQGLVIQAVGQKVIAYASIVSIFIQSLGAYHRLGQTAGPLLSATP